jgi:hypothetical protein
LVATTALCILLLHCILSEELKDNISLQKHVLLIRMEYETMDCCEVDTLYVGSLEALQNPDRFADLGITHVVTAAESLNERYPAALYKLNLDGLPA